MRWFPLLLAFAAAAPAADEFTTSIRPTLLANCTPCHSPAPNGKGPAPFLRATSAGEIDTNRSLWRNVAAQLRNRTMPPRDPRISEADRLHIATWIDQRLHASACTITDFAGPAVTRRLNRREYRSTIRDLFGVDFDITAMLPADGTGGAGFDTNGETLYVPPVLMERYLEAAQTILDRVILTPPVRQSFLAGKANTIAANLTVYLDGPYDLTLTYDSPSPESAQFQLLVDGAQIAGLNPTRRRNAKAADAARLTLNLARGAHTFAISTNSSAKLQSLLVSQRADAPTGERRAAHFRLLGLEPGDRPAQPRLAAQRLLESFASRAFRRPATSAEVDRFLKLYDRAADRNDPYEERLKLALKAILVWPDFLFRIEKKHSQPGLYPLSSFELATRLSYFLWSTMPDDQLTQLAASGRLQDPQVLAAQVDRMLDDPRSKAFLSSFTGQWLGTQEIGGRVVPLLTEIQHYYSPEIAADLKQQPVLMFERIVSENRSLLDLLTAPWTHLTARLARFYQIETQVPVPDDGEFHLVEWPANTHRAGVLGLAGVLAMSSRYNETSPVLRGAWVLETLLGTPVPPPPPDVPPLEKVAPSGHKLTMREKLELHRASSACAACHRLMDPIGLGLEQFDWMGRLRDADVNGKPIDASGQLPSGETFAGATQLRQALLTRKTELVENLVSRVMGYALGRSLQDGDSCTVRRLVESLEKDNYGARTLIRQIVLSTPFRHTQGGQLESTPLETSRKLDLTKLNAAKQDAESHNNAVKVVPKDVGKQ